MQASVTSHHGASIFTAQSSRAEQAVHSATVPDPCATRARPSSSQNHAFRTLMAACIRNLLLILLIVSLRANVECFLGLLDELRARACRSKKLAAC